MTHATFYYFFLAASSAPLLLLLLLLLPAGSWLTRRRRLLLLGRLLGPKLLQQLRLALAEAAARREHAHLDQLVAAPAGARALHALAAHAQPCAVLRSAVG